MGGFGVVILAGGAGRRLGGAAKPAVAVAGQPMLVRVLAAVDDATERIVVGPGSLGSLLPDGVRIVQEEPPGGGPVAGLAAGIAGLRSTVERVVVLAADLPLLTRAAVGELLGALGGHDGAVLVDDGGRQQWLCGAWAHAVLERRLGELAGTGPLVGRSMRELVAPLAVVGVPLDGGGRPPWYDCDTPADVVEVERRLA